MTQVRRHDFLYSLVGAALAGLSPAAVRAAVPDATRRVLWMRRAGSGEEVAAPFCVDGRTIYEPGYRQICWLMRDHQIAAAQGYVQIDIVEIEALWEVQRALALHGIMRPLIITSGYRSVATNMATEGAARNSMHCYGKAADMYVDGTSTTELFDLCWSRAVSGGIGYYDSHVHLDSGTRRWWAGDVPVPDFPARLLSFQE
ncbi:MAG: D-Ala-D-Ala carboxypeptidase family metallohydrolase [Candidatus Cybelea sp.]